MNDHPPVDRVLAITKETLIKRWPLLPEHLLEDEKIWVSPCAIRLDSFSEEELRGENWNGHIKVTFPIPEGYTTWYVERKDCRIELFTVFKIKNQAGMARIFGSDERPNFSRSENSPPVQNFHQIIGGGKSGEKTT
jgi:hypothetical protein